jgi:hypothetical protein
VQHENFYSSTNLTFSKKFLLQAFYYLCSVLNGCSVPLAVHLVLEVETVCTNGAETQQKEEGNMFSLHSFKFHDLGLKKVQLTLSAMSFSVSLSKNHRSKGWVCLAKLHRLVLEFISSFLTAKQPLFVYMMIRESISLWVLEN